MCAVFDISGFAYCFGDLDMFFVFVDLAFEHIKGPADESVLAVQLHETVRESSREGENKAENRSDDQHLPSHCLRGKGFCLFVVEDVNPDENEHGESPGDKDCSEYKEENRKEDALFMDRICCVRVGKNESDDIIVGAVFP